MAIADRRSANLAAPAIQVFPVSLESVVMPKAFPLFLAAFCLLGAGLSAQSVQVQPRSGAGQAPGHQSRFDLQLDWATRYDHGIIGHDGFAATATDSTGNVFAVGNSLGGGGSYYSYEVLTTKYDNFGNLLWERRFDSAGAGFNDAAVDLAVADDGSVVVLATGPTTTSDQDVLLFRYDATGTLLWQYTWSYNWSDGAQKVEIAPDGSIYVLAQSYYGIPGVSNVVLIKFDQSGALSWERNYDGHGGTDNPKMMAIDANGNIYIGGETIMTYGTVNFDWLGLKYDSAGNLLWAFEDGGAISYPDYVNDMALHPSGGMVLTGYQSNSIIGWGGTTDITTIYINAAGNLIWKSTYPGIQGRMHTVTVDSSGNTYVSGEPSLIISYDSNGQQRWEQDFLAANSLNGTAYGLAIDARGILLASGRSYNQFFSTDLLMMALDSSSGAVIGHQVYDYGSSDDSPIGSGSRAMALHPGRVVYQVGTSSNGHDGDGVLLRFTY
jgi:hypothetical protein